MRSAWIQPIVPYNRRAPLLGVLCLAAILAACGPAERRPRFEQKPLPYAEDALAPYISAEALRLHYGTHHAGYVRAANRLAAGAALQGKSPEAIIRFAADKPRHAALFNNAAQAWNHAFFWECLTPGGGGRPAGPLALKIDEAFGGFDAFKEKFLAAAADRFGSGWVWLVMDGGKLEILSTANADTPLAHGLTPLFTVDVWEHAYYLDYRSRRVDFVAAVIDHLANWDFAASQLPD